VGFDPGLTSSYSRGESRRKISPFWSAPNQCSGILLSKEIHVGFPISGFIPGIYPLSQADDHWADLPPYDLTQVIGMFEEVTGLTGIE